eukprot:2522143-Prorocentrum_lima.AAC.1
MDAGLGGFVAVAGVTVFSSFIGFGFCASCAQRQRGAGHGGVKQDIAGCQGQQPLEVPLHLH